MRRMVSLLALLFASSCWLAGATLQLPEHVVAGQEFSLQTNGSGSATFYLFGPATAIKRSVKLGAPIKVEAGEVPAAGRYVLVLGRDSATFFAAPGATKKVVES